MTLSLIVAMTRSGVIGRGGQLPWRLSADLQRFKSLTMGHAIIMGRKTYESLGRPLPGRTSIVISRQKKLALPPEVLVASSWEQALERASQDEQPFVIGGAEIFALALPLVERLLVTWVEADVEGDVRFPEWDRADWRLAEQEHHSSDAKNQYDYTFAIYERRPRHAPPAPTKRVNRPPLRFRLASSPPSKVTVMPSELAKQLLDLNQKLLVAILSGDWKTYESLCDSSITCFEPEARGQVVVGMPFHKFYFDLPAAPQKPGKNVTMTQPHVRLIGETAAVLSYVRLTQSLGADGAPQTSRVEETRVWQKIGGEWKHVHFHRSGNA